MLASHPPSQPPALAGFLQALRADQGEAQDSQRLTKGVRPFAVLCDRCDTETLTSPEWRPPGEAPGAGGMRGPIHLLKPVVLADRQSGG